MKRILAVLLTVAFLAAGTLIAFAAEGPADVKIQNKNGDIAFPHHMHQTKVPDCKTCHHGGDTAACRSCHGVKAEAPKFKDVGHKFCKGCHKDQNGPTKCNGCHKK